MIFAVTVGLYGFAVESAVPVKVVLVYQPANVYPVLAVAETDVAWL